MSRRGAIPLISPEFMNANAPMTGTKSKRKGASAELELCRVLSRHLGGSFIRTSGSGAYVGGKNSHRAQHLGTAQLAGVRGDLVPPDHLPHLVVEAKSYAAFRFHQLLQPQGSAQLDQWIDQATAGATATDVVVVAFKITRTGWFVVVPAGEWVLGHHCRYGEWLVTDLNQFLADNAQTLLRVCGS